MPTMVVQAPATSSSPWSGSHDMNRRTAVIDGQQ